MLKEIFLYLTTPVKKELKKGHLYESIALGERSKEYQKQWERHYKLCQDTITEHIQKTDAKGVCMVLGSGYCLDLPIEKLLKTFNQILLVDTIHPKSVRKRFQTNSKVQLIETDLTSWAYFQQNNSVSNFEKFVPQFDKQFVSLHFDYLISDNVLTQLPILPVRQIRELKNYTDEKEDTFANRIIKAHYEFIKSKKGLLLTDIQCHFYEKNSEELLDPLYGFKLPEPIRTWNWELVAKKQTHQVGVWDLSDLK